MDAKIIIGNWKMNLGVSEAVDLAKKLGNFLLENPKIQHKCVICPSFPLIYPVFSAIERFQLNNSPLNNFYLGAQNCHQEDSGALTGEVSAKALAGMGVEYVILGHSERRVLFGETSELVKEKVINAKKNHLKPVVCIGETLAERDSGHTESVLVRQLKDSLPSLNDEVIIAYEPVWAIGSGLVPTDEDIRFAALLVRDLVKKETFLYGGSVNSRNAKQILGIKGVNGLLVGGASLKFDEISAILS